MHSATRSPSPIACSPALLALLGLLALTACSRQPAAPAAEPQAAAPAAESPAVQAREGGDGSHLPPGIDWFQGDVDAAFAAAKAANKPLFLFWGAEWCPPCAQIKSTIFNTREFQERSRLFVPVYLDGDTPSAQRDGERFGVVGYPTMILFRADGQEIMRLPGGVDIERYATILDTALASSRPMLEILRAATNGVAMEPADWQLLAWYSWSTDNGRLVPAADRVDIFGRMYRYCPEELKAERGRILFEYLRALAADAKARGKTGPQVIDTEDRKLLVRSLMRLLGSQEAIRANVENLLFAPTEAVGVLSDPGSPEREQLVFAWRSALDSLSRGFEGLTLSGPETINVYRSRVQLAKLAAPDAPLPPELLDEARATATRVLAAAPEGYARHATANAAGNLYFEAGLDAEANALLLAEIEKSKSPYYFMLELADLAKKAGREDEALAWLERAYAQAQGPATRFQWGYNYLVGLLEMQPGNAAVIERVALEVLGELDDSPDAFYQRTRQRLEQLSAKLLDWSKGDRERAAVVATLRKRTADICAGLPSGDEGRASCEAFLRPAAAATTGA
jgi:thiol-disulfide isomerase/thioredoxin